MIKFIFDQDQLVFVVRADRGDGPVRRVHRAGSRARRCRDAFWPLLVALALAAPATLVLVVALGVFEPKPRFLVPVGGMVVGNSMTAAAVALNRLGDEVRSSARADRGDARPRRDGDPGDAAGRCGAACARR